MSFSRTSTSATGPERGGLRPRQNARRASLVPAEFNESSPIDPSCRPTWTGPPCLPSARPTSSRASTGDTDGELRYWRFHVDWRIPAELHLQRAYLDPRGRPQFQHLRPVLIACRSPAHAEPRSPQRPPHVPPALPQLRRPRVAAVQPHRDTDGSDHAGIRWYELRNPNGAPPEVYQQGTYAPSSTDNRWMGAIAMDQDGNMALGYSAGSSSIYPSIRYTGRLATRPAGHAAAGRKVLVAGTARS